MNANAENEQARGELAEAVQRFCDDLDDVRRRLAVAADREQQVEWERIRGRSELARLNAIARCK